MDSMPSYYCRTIDPELPNYKCEYYPEPKVQENKNNTHIIILIILGLIAVGFLTYIIGDKKIKK
jgi:hypothetical protein